MREYNTSGSKALYNEAKMYLVDGVSSSMHKAHNEEYPICMKYATGCHMFDVDGNMYIDYVGGSGAMLLGYSPDSVNIALEKQVHNGIHFSATTEKLLQLSKKITEIIPCAEMVSFQTSGTEANLHAQRIARAFTKKTIIVNFEGQYHGRTNHSAQTLLLPWNDSKILEQVLMQRNKEVAAIVMEPVMCNSGPIFPKKDYLKTVRALCTRYNVLLIFDEVITGFRLALGGAQEFYKVTPDLAVFGKALTNGLPLSIVCGKKQYMEIISSSGTFNATPLAVSAALAVIEELEHTNVYRDLDYFGSLLVQGILQLKEKHGIDLYTDNHNGICQLHLGITRIPETLDDYKKQVDQKMYDRFFLMARNHGVRLTASRGRLFLSTAHTKEDIKETLDIFDYIFSQLYK